MPRRKATELTFQQHIADFLVRVHMYGMLEQTDITDTEHCIAEDQLWAFLNAIAGRGAQEADGRLRHRGARRSRRAARCAARRAPGAGWTR